MIMDKLFIPIVLGTNREGNFSQKVADFVLAEAEKFGFETELVKVGDYGHTKTDERDKAMGWKEKMSRADGLIVVSPEYNHGYPGELKLFLDAIYAEYKRKPLGICGVSKSILGGARMVEQLRLVSIELSMVPIRNAVYFNNIQNPETFTDGQLTEADSYAERLRVMFEELAWYGQALKEARQKAS